LSKKNGFVQREGHRNEQEVIAKRMWGQVEFVFRPKKWAAEKEGIAEIGGG